MYDYRGVDGTGTAASPASGANAVSYTVRKLADGNCWMTDNLAMELKANTAYKGVNNTTGAEVTFNTGASCSADGNCIVNKNTVRNPDNGKYYYNWYAATANPNASGQAGVDMNFSICPARWRLPANYTIDIAKSYGGLTDAYNLTTNGEQTSTSDATLLVVPINLSYDGRYVGGEYSANQSIDYWSSTVRSTGEYVRGYRLYATTNDIIPQSNHRGYYGLSVRCVAL